MTANKFLLSAGFFVGLVLLGAVVLGLNSKPVNKFNEYMMANYDKEVVVLEDIEYDAGIGGDASILVALKDQPEMKFHIMVTSHWYESSFSIVGNKYEEAQMLHRNYQQLEPYTNNIAELNMELIDKDDLNRLYFLNRRYGETLYFTQKTPLDTTGLVEEDVKNYYSLVELVKSSGAEVEEILIEITSGYETRLKIQDLDAISSEDDLLNHLLLTSESFRTVYENAVHQDFLSEMESDRFLFGGNYFDNRLFLQCKEFSNVDYCDTYSLYVDYIVPLLLDDPMLTEDFQRLREGLQKEFSPEAAFHVVFSGPNFGATIYNFLDRTDEQTLATMQKIYDERNE